MSILGSVFSLPIELFEILLFVNSALLVTFASLSQVTVGLLKSTRQSLAMWSGLLQRKQRLGLRLACLNWLICCGFELHYGTLIFPPKTLILKI